MKTQCAETISTHLQYKAKFLHKQRFMIVEMLLLQLEDTAVHQLYLAEIFFHPLWFVKMLL